MSSETVGLFNEEEPITGEDVVVEVEVTEPAHFERVDLRDVLKMAKTEWVTTTALIESAEVKETGKGDPFVAYVLRDRTGKVDAKHWDTDQAIEPGNVVKVRAEVGLYRDQVQLKVDRIRIFEEDNDKLQFVPATEFDAEELESEFLLMVDHMGGEHAQFLRSFIYANSEAFENFVKAPAALTYHHAYWHGLLEHTVSMIWLARKICDHYNTLYEDGINKELVLCGVILHDFAKSLDQEWNGAEWVETEQAKLVGHIPTCIALLQAHYQVNPCVPIEVLRDLQHLVAAHHGQLEFGSPVVPKTVEALILHHVDMIDSKMAMWRQATDGLATGEWSAWSRPLRSEFRR